MAKLTKRAKMIAEKVEAEKVYDAEEALQLLKDVSSIKFDEGVDVSVNLGIDPKKSDQNVRGSTVLPNGTGKTVRVAVFADGEKADAAKTAGADIVGMDDLADEIKKGMMDFDVIVAAPEAMRVVGQLGTVLGPRGLMPNPKVGTVTPDVATAVKNAKGGQVQYRTEKGGIIHCPIGKLSFDVKALNENLGAVMADLKKAKPSAAKGVYFKKVSISSTMGPGLEIDEASISE